MSPSTSPSPAPCNSWCDNTCFHGANDDDCGGCTADNDICGNTGDQPCQCLPQTWQYVCDDNADCLSAPCSPVELCTKSCSIVPSCSNGSYGTESTCEDAGHTWTKHSQSTCITTTTPLDAISCPAAGHMWTGTDCIGNWDRMFTDETSCLSADDTYKWAKVCLPPTSAPTTSQSVSPSASPSTNAPTTSPSVSPSASPSTSPSALEERFIEAVGGDTCGDGGGRCSNGSDTEQVTCEAAGAIWTFHAMATFSDCQNYSALTGYGLNQGNYGPEGCYWVDEDGGGTYLRWNTAGSATQTCDTQDNDDVNRCVCVL